MSVWCLAHTHTHTHSLKLSPGHSDRLIRLLEEIMSEKENKTIIFVETKRRCDELTRRMRRDGCVSSFISCFEVSEAGLTSRLTHPCHTLVPQMARNGNSRRQEPAGAGLGPQW